jgi:hypothetical protein
VSGEEERRAISIRDAYAEALDVIENALEDAGVAPYPRAEV